MVVWHVWFSFISIGVVVVVVAVFFLSFSFLLFLSAYTARILNVNGFHTNKWKPTYMKWAQQQPKSGQKGFFYLIGFFFFILFSLRFVWFTFRFVCVFKITGIRSFSELFTSFTSFTLLFSVSFSPNGFIFVLRLKVKSAHIDDGPSFPIASIPLRCVDGKTEKSRQMLVIVCF